ncbi:MAG: hypothetical protein ACM3O6_10470 [Acidobacteriota bacterium]
MNPIAAPYLDALRQAAEQSAAAEEGYRRDYAARIAALERDRAFAFRRLNLIRSLSETIAAAADEKTAVANALAVLRDKLGWVGDSEARAATAQRFAAVVEAMVAAKEGTIPADVPAALAAFETWYADAHGSPFWVLFDHYMPETPRVDF